MTNGKKIDREELAKVQGGKGGTPAKASAGRKAGTMGSKGSNVSSKRR